MSDAEDENFCKYGTPLELLDEDDLPRKRPITVEDQYALDVNGRRRFHGAFTGGFTAGFCNSVGSLEGFTPSTFKSSRSEKATSKVQKPEDFMDTEDREEWGIAPKRLQSTNDYGGSEAANNKRKRPVTQSGVIPGEPVLQMLLAPPQDNIGARLLKAMGWREGQGVGPRRNADIKFYGCQRPGENIDNKENSNIALSGITLAPVDCEIFLAEPKLNTFGMGYSGLDRKPVLEHFSLFQSHELKFTDKNKKVSISGQAFGVGALEDEDTDIYSRDDMSQYDFTTGPAIKEKSAKKKTTDTQSKYIQKCLEGFHLSNMSQRASKKYPVPSLPVNYKPTCGRKTRFEPIIESNISSEIDYKKKGLGRHDISVDTRRDLLTDNMDKKDEIKIQEESNRKIVNEALLITSTLGNSTGSFKPFAADQDKERRYHDFLKMSIVERATKFERVQPLGMTSWERERERKEFEQAERLYKPLQGAMSDRFISAGQSTTNNGDDCALVDAAKAKMFGKLTRVVETWRPVNLLCKRFNVPVPAGGCAPDEEVDKKPTNFSVFDYLEGSVHNKESFRNKTSLREPSNTDTDKQHVSDAQSNNDEQIVTNNKSPTTNITITKLKLPEPKNDVTANTNIESLFTHDTISSPNIDSNEQMKSYQMMMGHTAVTNPITQKSFFQSIFLSSSESESEDEDAIKKNLEKMKKFVLEDFNKVNTVAQSAGSSKKKEIEEVSSKNVLRNDSAPSGIFANIDLDAINKRTSTNVSIDNINKPIDSKIDLRKDDVESKINLISGPRLPDRLLYKNNMETNDFPKKIINIESSDTESDDWIEKDKAKKKKHKHKNKKNKKRKSSHKLKHKSSKDKHKMEDSSKRKKSKK